MNSVGLFSSQFKCNEYWMRSYLRLSSWKFYTGYKKGYCNLSTFFKWNISARHIFPSARKVRRGMQKQKYIAWYYSELIFLVLMERKTWMLTNDCHTWQDINYSPPIIYSCISFSLLLYLGYHVLHSFFVPPLIHILFHNMRHSFTGMTNYLLY